jgi:stage IV sporulation protein FB
MNFKRLWKIDIHYFTIIYIVISFFTGYWKYYLGAYIIVCFHEICHLLMAYSFHFQIDRITLLPFGAYLSLNDFGYRPIIYEMCVVLAGPCSHLLIYSVLISLKKTIYIEYLLNMNSLIFIFNILPIYPMDGYRFLLLNLERFIDIQKANYLCLKISIMFLCLFVCICKHLNYYIIFLFLLSENIKLYKSIPNYLRLYFLQIPYDYHNKKIKIHQKKRYIRDCINLYKIDNLIIEDYNFQRELIKNVKRL